MHSDIDNDNTSVNIGVCDYNCDCVSHHGTVYDSPSERGMWHVTLTLANSDSDSDGEWNLRHKNIFAENVLYLKSLYDDKTLFYQNDFRNISY